MWMEGKINMYDYDFEKLNENWKMEEWMWIKILEFEKYEKKKNKNDYLNEKIINIFDNLIKLKKKFIWGWWMKYIL